MAHIVISECVDARTGKRYAPALPGQPLVLFPATDPVQAARLTAAGCLREVADKSLSPAQLKAAGVTRAETEAELNEMALTLAAARQRRDSELAYISAELGKARADADAELAKFRDDIAAARAAASQTSVAAAVGGTTVTDPAKVARDQVNDDGLFDKTVPELKAIGEAEGVDLGGARKQDEVVAAIRAKRAGKA